MSHLRNSNSTGILGQKGKALPGTSYQILYKYMIGINDEYLNLQNQWSGFPKSVNSKLNWVTRKLNQTAFMAWFNLP